MKIKPALLYLATLALLAGPAAAQQTAPVGGLPAVGPDVEDRAAADRARYRSGKRVDDAVIQGQNPYDNYQRPYQPTFTSNGLVAPGVTPDNPAVIVPPPPAAAPCVPGAKRTC